jgi:alkylated DNA repair dioxygenase AlkB
LPLYILYLKTDNDKEYQTMDQYVKYHKSALEITDDLFKELWDLMDIVPFTPNPMNKKYNIKRKQGTFGSSYAFGAQVSHQLKGDNYEDWPELVLKVLEHTRQISGCDLYNVVHVNWYPDGTAGLDPHSDDMRKMVPNMDIYSYTFLSKHGTPRGFQVYDKKTNEQVHEFMLDHGDLLIMTAEMQNKYKHGVKKSTAKKYRNLKRINLTVRAWA